MLYMLRSHVVRRAPRTAYRQAMGLCLVMQMRTIPKYRVNPSTHTRIHKAELAVSIVYTPTSNYVIDGGSSINKICDRACRASGLSNIIKYGTWAYGFRSLHDRVVGRRQSVRPPKHTLDISHTSEWIIKCHNALSGYVILDEIDISSCNSKCKFGSVIARNEAQPIVDRCIGSTCPNLFCIAPVIWGNNGKPPGPKTCVFVNKFTTRRSCIPTRLPLQMGSRRLNQHFLIPAQP